MKTLFHLTLLFALSASSAAQTRMLFVGNSFTYGNSEPAVSYNRDEVRDLNGFHYGGVPGILKKMTVQQGLDFVVAIEAPPGETLHYHLHEKAPILTQDSWDVVVLQENSTRPLPRDHQGKPELFIAAADGLFDLFAEKNPGVKLFLYETWASPTSAEHKGYDGNLAAMQKDLNEAYFSASHRVTRGAGTCDFSGVARVGEAFMLALNRGIADGNCSDGIQAGKTYLWDLNDSRHAGPSGSYLAAAVIYGTVTQRDPRQLDTGKGSAAADLGIDPELAKALHQIAFEMLSKALPLPSM